MKIHRGKKRIAYKLLASRRADRRMIQRALRDDGSYFSPSLRGRAQLIAWAAQLRPGDLFASCCGYNRRVKSIELQWTDPARYQRHASNSKHRIVREVLIIDEDDEWHYCPGGGCALPPESYSKVLSNYTTLLAKVAETNHEHLILAALQRGDCIFDADGIMLPEWRYHE